MDLEKIKALIRAMEEKDIRKLVLKEKEEELQLERGSGVEVIAQPTPTPGYVAQAPQIPAAHVKEEIKEEATYITSPMVGTFYITPSPEDPPFIKVGDEVDKDKAVCIIEAMKVMNEVKAGKAGVIAEILVENGHPVEFGTKLFRVK